MVCQSLKKSLDHEAVYRLSVRRCLCEEVLFLMELEASVFFLSL